MQKSWARLVVAIALCAGLSFASSVEVEVLEPSGAVVVDAIVSVETSAGVSLLAVHTSELGLGRLSDVAPGAYVVRVVADEFKPWTQTLRLRDGEQVQLQATLELATLTTIVEVYGEAAEPVGTVTVGVLSLDEDPSTDLIDNLRSVPGLSVLRRGGANLEPILFGLRETQLVMTVDATRAFAAGPARMDSELSHVEAGHVAEVKVVTGPYALAEGAGAMGAITVRTPDVPRFDRFRFGGRTHLGWGSNGSSRFGRTRIYGGDRVFGFSLRAAGNKANDYQAGRSGGLPELTVPGDFSNHQLGGKLRFNPTDDQELALSGLYDEQTGLDYPGRLLNVNHFILRGWNGAYLWRQPSKLVQAAKLNFYLNKKSHRMSNFGKPTARDMPGRMPPFALDVSLPTESDTWGGAGYLTLTPSEDWTIQTGFDFYNAAQDAQRYVSRQSNGFLIFSDAVWPDVSIADQGGYVVATRRYDRGEISSSLRLDLVQADAGRPSDFFLDNTQGALDQSEANVSFSVGGNYSLAGGVSVGGGFGRVVRTANGLERYSDRFPSTKFQVAAEFLGDPALAPEASWQGDLNLQISRGDLSLQGGVFYRRLTNYITVFPDPDVPKRLPLSPPLVYRYLNGDHATFRGFQFGAFYRLFSLAEWKLQGAKTIADDIEESNGAIGFNEPVIGIPPFEVSSALRLNDPKFRFWGEYEVRIVASQQRVAASRPDLKRRLPASRCTISVSAGRSARKRPCTLVLKTWATGATSST